MKLKSLLLIFTLVLGTTLAHARGPKRHIYLIIKNAQNQVIKPDPAIQSKFKTNRERTADDWVKTQMRSQSTVKKVSDFFCSMAQPRDYTVQVGRHWKGKNKFITTIKVRCANKGNQGATKEKVSCPQNLFFRASGSAGFGEAKITARLDKHTLNGNTLRCDYKPSSSITQKRSGCERNATKGEFTCTK